MAGRYVDAIDRGVQQRLCAEVAQRLVELLGKVPLTAADGFERGRSVGRDLWDRRYAMVDEQRGMVLTNRRRSLLGVREFAQRKALLPGG